MPSPPPSTITFIRQTDRPLASEEDTITSMGSRAQDVELTTLKQYKRSTATLSINRINQAITINVDIELITAVVIISGWLPIRADSVVPLNT
jgi:hypothetical protein